jgi:hypothetical protein
MFRAIGPAAVLLLVACRTFTATTDQSILENAQLRIEVNPANGAISRILDKPGRIDLRPIAELADVFRLVVRNADKKNHLIVGRSQRLVRSARNGDRLNLTWAESLIDGEGSAHQINVHMTLALVGEALEIRLVLQNHSPHMVTEVSYPMISGLRGLGGSRHDDETSVMLPTSIPTIKKLTLPFDEVKLPYPGTLNMSYVSVFNTKTDRSMYLAAHDTVGRLKNYRFTEESTSAGKDVVASVQFAPYTAPGKEFDGPPVVLRFQTGSIQAAGKIYREWFVKNFPVLKPSQNWIRQNSFIQDTMFLLPEGTVNLTFKDIPRWAADAHDHGINAVLISGWHRGGHDNGYPHYEPDPRLGTYDDLKSALEECHRVGVRVYFFVNFNVVTVGTDWYKNELHDYVEMREDGGSRLAGWGMGTLWARMGHPKLMAFVDTSIPRYGDALLKQFLKLVKIGADGLHVDKMLPAAVNFNPRRELGPDIAPWEGPIRLSRRLMEESRKINPQFALSFECNWDRMLEFGNAVWWVGNLSFARTVFPEMVETAPLTSAFDYIGVNNAVRSSHVGLVGPQNYTRSVAWKPWQGLAKYIQEVKRIQDSLSDAVFFGAALDGAQIKLGHEPAYGVGYSIYGSLTGGHRVCILTNSGMEDQSQMIQAFASRTGGAIRIHTPFAASRDVVLPTNVMIPSERIVFIEELPASVQQNHVAANEKPIVPPATASVIVNGDFETGDFSGWSADPNWKVDKNTAGVYRGWHGKHFAWSGGQGEAATGRLRSQAFVLDQEGVRLLMAGWCAHPKSPQRIWNYISLKSVDGVEISRRNAPNSLQFVPVLLDGSGYMGKKVYLEAVDEGDQSAYSMFCIDDVRTVPLPPNWTQQPNPSLLFDEKEMIKLENDLYRVQVSRTNGAITRILDKIANLELIREPRLADNFKFTLPIPGKESWETTETNYIVGRSQVLSSHEIKGQALTLKWQSALKNCAGEKYDVDAMMGITLEGQVIRFSLMIDNRTPYRIGEVFFPMLGGLTGLGHNYRELKSTQLVRPTWAEMVRSDIFRQFANFSELGDQGPEQYYSFPRDLSEPWIELVNTSLHRSVYLGAHDDRSLTARLELLPGSAEKSRWDGNWPRREELNGLPAGVVFSFVDFAHHPSGKNYESAPVILHCEGGNKEPGQPYRQWKNERPNP